MRFASTDRQPDEIEAAIRELAPWHFDMELHPGVRTGDLNPSEYEDEDHRGVGLINPEEMIPLLETVLPGGIKGHSFLDVGCNAGGYCFVAHSLGATRAHGFDVREHWIHQARLVKELLAPQAAGLEFQVADAKTFSHVERYDVTLFKGIFYHLPDPANVLRQICDMTERAIIVDTASTTAIPPATMVPWRESTTHVMSGVDGLAWLPGGPAAIKPILEWAGFPYMRVVEWRGGSPATRNRGRFRVFATRSESDQANYAGPEYRPV